MMIDWDAVVADVRDGKASRMDAVTARVAKLAAWACLTAAPESPLRRECMEDFAAAWRQFIAVDNQFASLVSAWCVAGIDIVVFKGYPLAKWFYPHAAIRTFSDVDVYIDPAQADRALAALPAGWRAVSTARGFGQHAVASLISPDRRINVDLHTSLVPRPSLAAAARTRLARQVLRAAGRKTLGNGSVLVPQPADLLLIGLAVNRGWGSDRWVPAATDYLDARLLLESGGLDAASMRRRARQLGLAATWRAWLRICDPLTGRLELKQPRRSATFRLRQDLTVGIESRATMLRAKWIRLRLRPGAAIDVLKTLPTLLQVTRDSLRRGGPSSIVNPRRWPARHGGEGEGRELMRIVRGVRWTHRLLAPALSRLPTGPCVIRSVTLYRLMVAEGFSPDWVSGMCVDETNAVVGHAWVELEGTAVAGFGDEFLMQRYKEIARIRPETGSMSPAVTTSG